MGQGECRGEWVKVSVGGWVKVSVGVGVGMGALR